MKLMETLATIGRRLLGVIGLLWLLASPWTWLSILVVLVLWPFGYLELDALDVNRRWWIVSVRLVVVLRAGGWARDVWARWWLGKLSPSVVDPHAVALPLFILLDPVVQDELDGRRGEAAQLRAEQTLAHELVHTRDHYIFGFFMPIIYLLDYAQLRVRYAGQRDGAMRAYRDIWFERRARRAAGQED